MRPRVATPTPAGDDALADLFLSVQQLGGHDPMPWQVDTLTRTSVRHGSAWASNDVGLIVSRQNGKTDVVGAKLIGHARFLCDRCLYTTASGAAAVDTWRRIDEWVDNSPLLRRKLRDIKRSNGRERMLFAGGGVIQIATTGGKPPRGFDRVALLVYDEARELHSWAPLAALDPTQAVIGRRAQRWLVSNAGDDRSVVLNDLRDTGRALSVADATGTRAWLEYSAPPGAARDDVDALAAANPALGHTLDLDWLLAKAGELPEAEFRAEHMCQWQTNLATVVDAAVWDALEDPDGPLPGLADLALGFDVALDRSDAAVCAAWRVDGRAWVQCVDHRPGTDWLVPRLLELLARWRAPVVGFDAAGPALDVADELTRALAARPPGLGPVELSGLSGRDYAAACSSALVHITDGRLSHAHADPVGEALAAAGTRPLADAWAWGRRGSSGSIAALVAYTVALWCYDHAPRPGRPIVAAGRGSP